MQFILDGMLGRLARWLRMAGFDTLYCRDMDDDSLISESHVSQRVLLSRDMNLIQRAKKRGVEAHLIESERVQEQLIQIKDQLGIDLKPSISRCPTCNGVLDEKTKEEVADKVPKDSLEAYNEFWVCRECGAVYWKGSHWGKILETLDRT